MKITMLEPLGVSKETIDTLAKPLIEQGHEFVPCYSPIAPEEKLARAKGSDAFIIANSPLSGEIIRAAEDLKIISVGFAGVDHVDKTSCIEKGVRLMNAAGYCTDAVAELTVAMMIDLLRSVREADQKAREGGTKAGLREFEFRGKTVGIIGTGHIGIRVAELCRAFGCRVLGWNRSRKEAAVQAGIEYTDLDDLLKRSDIVTLHVPLTDSTRDLIDADAIAKMKDGAYLVNCARGPVVNSKALAEALQSGKLAGAASDVYESEPPVSPDHVLFSAPNFLATPHIGFYTVESMQRRGAIVFENVYAWLDGRYINEAKLN